MPYSRFFLAIVFLPIFVLSACSPALGGPCPVTQFDNPVFIPPEPMPAEAPSPDMFWHGTEKLWTMLPKSGQWEDLPLSDHGYGQKTVWWSPGYDWQADPNPTFELVARPLERLGEEYRLEEATNLYDGELGSAILLGVQFPYSGCWEVTGNYNGESLSYVVEIIP